MAEEHKLEVTPLENSRFTWLVHCCCGWEGRAVTYEHAQQLINQHLLAKARAAMSL